MTEKPPIFYSNIWQEEAEADNPFAAKACYSHGYDVYGELLHKASWFEYLLLQFTGEKPSTQQTQLLERVAVAIANPGIRDASVRAAMNSGVSRATHAATLMAALAIGAGQYGGSHEVYLCIQRWQQCGLDTEKWLSQLMIQDDGQQTDIWLAIEHIAGFDPHGESCPTPVLQTLALLATIKSDGALMWLQNHRLMLEQEVGYPLAMSGVIAAAFYDVGLDEHQASMLYLMLRLPGAAAHALEQRGVGWKKFPFVGNQIELTDDPQAQQTAVDGAKA